MSAGDRPRPPPFAADSVDLGCCRLVRLAAGDRAIAPLAALLAAIDPWRRLGYDAAALAAYLDRADPGLGRFRINSDAGDVGVLCIRYPWLRGVYIELIGLAADGQRAGRGGAVIAWLMAEIAGRAGNLWATVSAGNGRGRDFYRRHGFVELVPLDDLVRAGEAEILLRRRLG